MKVQKTHWLRNTILVLAACGILGGAIAAVRFSSAQDRTTYASSSIQFSFDGAASGVAPSGNVFNIEGIFSDAVLSDALKASGLDDRYTAEQIRGQLSVEGLYPKDIVQQLTNYDSLLDFSSNRVLTVSEYRPTVYSVKLYRDFDPAISRASLESLLQNIMEAYKRYFTKVYSLSANNIALEYDLADYDYPQQLVILSSVMNQSRRYALELYEKEPFLSVDGCGFSDIAVRLGSLINNDIDSLNAAIFMDGLTKDTARLLTQYRFEISSLSNESEKQKECLAKLDELIASYDKNEIIYLSNADSFTKIDGNSSETYDALVAERKSLADEITQIDTQIATYRLQINDLLNNSQASQEKEGAAEIAGGETLTMTDEEIAAAAKAAEELSAQKIAVLEESIAKLVEQYNGINATLSKLLDAYNAKTINDSTVEIIRGAYSAPKFLSGSFAVTLVKTAGPICAVGLLVCLVFLIASRKKEQKAG